MSSVSTEITVKLRHDHITMSIVNKCYKYQKSDNRCRIFLNEKEEIILNDDYLNVFMKAFISVIQYHKFLLKKLIFDAKQSSDEKPFDPTDFQRFSELLRNLEKPFQVEMLHFRRMKLDVSCHIISLVKPGFLRYVEIQSSYETMNYDAIHKKMVELEQWKMVKQFFIKENFDFPLDGLFNAEVVELHRNGITSADLIRLKEKSPPDAEKSQKEVHIVEYLESKGYKYPTCRSSELKICAECHGITGFRSFRSHLKKFHKEFSQSVMDRLVEESPRTTVSKKTSMSSDDMISLVPWSVRYPELFRKLNNYNTADKTSMTKKRTDLWTSHSEYIELSDFLVKMTKNSGELVPQGEHRIASEYIENSRSTRTIYVLKRRVRNFRSTILENDKFDTETKVKLVFLLSASVGSTFLEKIRQTAHVELDEENRITVYKSETLNLQGDHSISAKLRALQADKKRRKNQIPVKNETEKPRSSEIQTDGKIEELTEVVDLTMDSYDPEQSEKAQSEKLRISDSKNSDAKAEASESKKEKSSESQPSNLKKLFLKAKSSKILISKSSNTREEMPDSAKKVSSEYSDKKSMLPEPKSSIRRVPSVKFELLLPKTSIRVAPPTTKPEKDGKSIGSKAPKSEKKDSPSISQFFPKVSNAPTAEKPKSSNTVAPPASESKNESIYEIEEPPKRQVSSTKSEDKRSESVRIHVSGCPVTPKSTESDSESDETYVCEEEKYCREEYEEDTGEEEESDESSNNSEDETISEMEERQVSDSESENSENSELTENSGCDEEDVEDCIVDDEEEEEEEESEIHQTPPFRPQTANGNESISPNSHKRFLKVFLIFVSSLDLPMLNDLEERIMDRILEIKQFEMRSQEKMTINEIRAGLMASLLIVTKSATSSSTSSSTESTISLSVFLELFEEFVVTLKWKSLKKFVQRMRSSIEELGEQDKRSEDSEEVIEEIRDNVDSPVVDSLDDDEEEEGAEEIGSEKEDDDEVEEEVGGGGGPVEESYKRGFLEKMAKWAIDQLSHGRPLNWDTFKTVVPTERGAETLARRWRRLVEKEQEELNNTEWIPVEIRDELLALLEAEPSVG